jgi:hypothetical protein
MAIYGFRVILDENNQDVFRDIEIESTSSFEDFHNSIIQGFGMEGGEMASFYKSDDHWNQGDEISLFPVDDKSFVMGDWSLEQMSSEKGDKFLYIYDFLNMWTFYVELMEIDEPKSGISYPRLIYSEGLMPAESGEKQFETHEDLSESNGSTPFEDDIFDGFDDFDQ